jgi:hypothetical protein
MQRKIWSSKNPLKETQNHTRFWQPARTYCLNMAISGGKKQSLKFSTFAKKTSQKSFVWVTLDFFWSPIGENLQKKTPVQGRIGSVYQDKLIQIQHLKLCYAQKFQCCDIYIFTYIKCREYIGALHKLYAMMIWYADVQLLMQKVIIYQTYSHKVVESNSIMENYMDRWSQKPNASSSTFLWPG